ncbi:MAG: Sec-independent protein translocase subunit TatA/TatB [Candidatus Kariarchaeaceae archaeon]|jgi:sec-independent protein translocase protein TatA
MLPGPTEILFIVGAFMLLFGPNKLPEIASALGEVTKKFREGASTTKTVLTDKIDQIDTVRKMTDDDIILNYANKLGIPTSGKSVSDLAQEILNLES